MVKHIGLVSFSRRMYPFVSPERSERNMDTDENLGEATRWQD